MRPPHPGVPFTIQPAGDAWEWRTFAADGALLKSGRTSSRKAAAAFVIREMCRAACPPEAASPLYSRAA